MGGYIGASAAYPMPVNAFLIERRIKKTSPEKLWEESFKDNKNNFSINYNNIEEVRITKERIWPKIRLKLTQKDEIVGNKPLFTFSSESREDLIKKVETVESIFMKMRPTRTIVIDKL